MQIEKLKIGETLTANNKIVIILDRLKQLTDEAISKGQDAPEFNLAEISAVDNPFMDNLGVDRERMPQLIGVPEKGSFADSLNKDYKGEVSLEKHFLQHLSDLGISTKETAIPVDELKPTQNHLCGSKVAGMVSKLKSNPKDSGITKPIFVSSDNYILDGHHRWAAVFGYQMGSGKDINMKVLQVNLPVNELFAIANNFVVDKGLKKKEAHASLKSLNLGQSLIL